MVSELLMVKRAAGLYAVSQTVSVMLKRFVEQFGAIDNCLWKHLSTSETY